MTAWRSNLSAPKGPHFDRLISSHDLRLPKEGDGFWAALQDHEPYDPERTLLVDDNLAVLQAAHAFGLKHLRGVAKPDSQRPELDAHDFVTINDFTDLGLPLS